MEISLQSKINYKSVYKQREKMIEEERLHIKDEIEYARFVELHKKHAPEISEEDFARYFLDIDYTSYYRLQSGIRKTSIILEREFYVEEEFDEIEKQIIEEYGLQPNSSINYEKLIEIWNKYGERFPLKMFAEEVLQINAKRVDDMNFKRNSEAIILKTKPEITRTQVRNLREKVAREAKLHMGESISIERFHELYNEYRIDGLDEKNFALKILGIQTDTYNRFIKGKKAKIAVFSSYPINPDDICSFREKIINTENLRIGTITVDRFWELYEKYGGILTAEVFVESILDNSIDTVKGAKRRKHDISILGKIEFPEEYLAKIREQVVIENQLKYNQLMSLEQMREIYRKMADKDKGCFLMGEKTFINKILGVATYNYQQLTSGATHRSYILADSEEVDLKDIRRRVIRENNLHYDDVLDYTEFHRLHEKYAPTVREYVFALQILDIDQRALDNIRHYKGTRNTHILLGEPLPTNDEIDEIKERVLREYGLKRNDKVNYKLFREMYTKYAGVMPEDMFAERVLDISAEELRKMKHDELYRTKILLRTFLTPDQMKEARREAKEKEKQEKKERKTRIAEEKALLAKEKKVKKVLERWIINEGNIEIIKKYIAACKDCQEKGIFPRESLTILKEAIEFIQGGVWEITIFCKICISMAENRRAYDFISDNIGNEGIRIEDKEKLRKLQKEIKYTIKKEQALEMLKTGNTDCKRISEELGILEIDVIRLQRELNLNAPHGGSPGAGGR